MDLTFEEVIYLIAYIFFASMLYDSIRFYLWIKTDKASGVKDCHNCLEHAKNIGKFTRKFTGLQKRNVFQCLSKPGWKSNRFVLGLYSPFMAFLFLLHKMGYELEIRKITADAAQERETVENEVTTEKIFRV